MINGKALLGTKVHDPSPTAGVWVHVGDGDTVTLGVTVGVTVTVTVEVKVGVTANKAPEKVRFMTRIATKGFRMDP